MLIVEGAKGDVLQAASIHELEPKGAMSLEEFNRLEGETLRMAELMVPFRSQLVGRSLAHTRFRMGQAILDRTVGTTVGWAMVAAPSAAVAVTASPAAIRAFTPWPDWSWRCAPPVD